MKQNAAEHYAENAQHDIKTGEGSKKILCMILKKHHNMVT